MKKLALSTIALAALAFSFRPVLACPNSDHDNNAPRTADKDTKDAPKADKAKEAPKSDAKPTDTAKKDTKDAPKADAKPAKDSKDTAKKPDKVSSK